MNEDKVGYCNPPKAHRFKKGESGNPLGRPPKDKSLKAICDKILGNALKVRQGGKVRTVNSWEAVLLKQRQLALQGNTQAASLLFRVHKYVSEQSPSADAAPMYSVYIPEKLANVHEWEEKFRPKTADEKIKDDEDKK